MAVKKPTALKIANGSVKHNPGRVNKNEPQDSRPIGAAPKSFDAIERRMWEELTSQAVPGVLTEADRASMEMCCLLMCEMRSNWDAFTAAKIARLTVLLQQFGMTPVGRSNISVPQDKDKPNPFSDL